MHPVGDQEVGVENIPYREEPGDVRTSLLSDADVVVIASTAIVLLIDATELSRIAYSARCYSTYTRLVCGVIMQSTHAVGRTGRCRSGAD